MTTTRSIMQVALDRMAGRSSQAGDELCEQAQAMIEEQIHRLTADDVIEAIALHAQAAEDETPETMAGEAALAAVTFAADRAAEAATDPHLRNCILELFA